MLQFFLRRVNHHRGRRRLGKYRYTALISRGLLAKRQALVRLWVALRTYRCCFFLEETRRPHNGCRTKKVPRRNRRGSRKSLKKVRQRGEKFLLYT
jgi:hypothetical protein